MEISIALPQTGKFASPETIGYAAEEAERRGYAAVWVLERLLRPIAEVRRLRDLLLPCRSLMLTYMTHSRH